MSDLPFHKPNLFDATRDVCISLAWRKWLWMPSTLSAWELVLAHWQKRSAHSWEVRSEQKNPFKTSYSKLARLLIFFKQVEVMFPSSISTKTLEDFWMCPHNICVDNRLVWIIFLFSPCLPYEAYTLPCHSQLLLFFIWLQQAYSVGLKWDIITSDLNDLLISCENNYAN